MRILIVEDDFVSRLVLQKMLSVYGTCDTAVNGREAVEAFAMAYMDNNLYDFIFMDIMMPEMDGKEALSIIRQKEKEWNISPRNETKIIMVTALDTPKDVIETFFKGGCTSYLVKPINKEKIVKSIRDFAVI